MASQRIVLTSPWKLGLFVFLLVVGCGFGLIYAYLELFGGTLQFEDDRTLKAFYAVVGGVALLGLLGYLAVVSSARPLDRVVRGGKKRERLLKKLQEIEDPRSVNPSDFDDEPGVARLLERWSQDASEASGAHHVVEQQREALSELAAKVQTASESQEEIPLEGDSTEFGPLVAAINQYVGEMRLATEPSPAPAADPRQAEEMDRLRQHWRGGLVDLGQRQRDMMDFAGSVARSAEELNRRAQAALSGGSGGTAPDVSFKGEILELNRANADRMENLRRMLEDLAEEANKLAIQTALQVSRLGESGGELLGLAEEVRSLSTRYQRLSSEARLCENDQQQTLHELERLAGGGASGAPSGGEPGLDVAAVQKLAMVLDQNAGGLQELLTGLGQQLGELERELEATTDSPAPAPSGSVAPVVPEPAMPEPSGSVAPVMPEPLATEPAMPMADPGALDISAGVRPVESNAPAPATEAIYDLQELGAEELSPEVDEDGQPIYDLRELGAVEL